MDKIERNPHVDNCHTIEEVAALIGRSGEPDLVAGQYAFDAAIDNDDLSSDSFEAHLAFLAAADAVFDWAEALSFAKQFSRVAPWALMSQPITTSRR